VCGGGQKALNQVAAHEPAGARNENVSHSDFEGCKGNARNPSEELRVNSGGRLS
jgi:hypothetical protein